MLSKRCKICKKPSDIVDLFEGVYDGEIIMVCEECAEEEKIPIIRRPSQNQLNQVDKKLSVRERMEKMSGMANRRTEVSRDQLIVQNSLNKLKNLPAKQTHPDVVDNYYWELRMARRRKKMTLDQVAKQTGVSAKIINEIEKGHLPKEFDQTLIRLEDLFGIKLLKHHKKKINFMMPQVDEEAVLDEVRKKMETRVIDEDEDDEFEELDKRRKEMKMQEIKEGEFDFSDKEKIDDLTLSDLAQLKKEKERKEKQAVEKQQADDMLGDDIEIEWDK